MFSIKSMNRRSFARCAIAGSCGSLFSSALPKVQAIQPANRVLKGLSDFDEPVLIRSIDLLKNGREYLVRVRSVDGREAITIPNSSRLRIAYPIFLQRVAPFFVGKDARDIESLVDQVYRQQSNYKLQGLLFWVCVAAVEMAILDLLGQASKKSIGEMFGGVVRNEVDVYRASGNRGNTPQAEIAYLEKLISETGAEAIKFRLGGRMSNNRDSLPGRTETLIPLVRKTFGDKLSLYADSNSSYDVENAIRIGRLMEAHDYAFFEEPCPFDHLWETKRVADELNIPVAGGEQEFSMRRFAWMIRNRAVDIVQPDLHYFGGFIRCTRVARMAREAGMDCTIHMSGSGLGYVNVLHFASYTPNCGKHQEFKGESRIPMQCDSSDLICRKGQIRVPTGPGFGVRIDPDFVKKSQIVG